MTSFDEQWQRWFSEDNNQQKNPSGSNASRAQKSFFSIVAGLFFLFILGGIGRGFYTDWLWFQSLGQEAVFAKILSTRLLIFIIAAAVFALIFTVNLVLATRFSPKAKTYFWPWQLIQGLQKAVRGAVIGGIAFFSLIFGLAAQGAWHTILRYGSSQPFGVTDPVFGREVSFYVFDLPFWGFVRGWLLGALIVTAIACLLIYLASYGAQKLKFDFARPVVFHAGILLTVILGLFAWSYWLGIWELVFSPTGVVFGASYTDIYARLPGHWIMLFVVIGVIGIIWAALFRHNARLVGYAVGGWIVTAILVTGIYPALLQRFQVAPNELGQEREYIQYNIEYTRQAFGLDHISEEAFPAEETPTTAELAANQVTLNNIRLWDPRPLKDTYNQIQAIRLYYDFNDVDIDRYTLDGDYQQVMLSAREMSAEKLSGEAQTWVNRRLQFTHGYGFTLSPVNEVTAQGLPMLMVKDIPPTGNIVVERPEIYYGEKTNDYVIVNSKTEEFDYPMGDQNIFGRYGGTGGVELNSFFRRLMYAWEFGDLNLLISNQLTPDSRVMYYRNIRQEVQRLAPFLTLDADPYLVVADGQMFWVQDAYTTTNRYPYSEPFRGGLNYIRNSVKAIVNAYDGSVTLYVTEPDDPLIQTYQAIFPSLFTPQEEMPAELAQHLRYPEDMFTIQASVYQSYHMQDARVFYNKEDLWTFPREVYAGNEQVMDPYYIIMRLPETDMEEFLLMVPFTPVNKNNAIGWLAARCDGDNYGKLLAYQFPKDKTVYGPSQIENRIQQDTVITEQLALWGRGGSRVIRGNLLLIPIGQSKIYVEPVFLQADAGGLPEMKRVIVAVGDNIIMKPTLAEALSTVFGIEAPTPPSQPPGTTSEPQTGIEDIADLIQRANEYYENAQALLIDGDWAGYGAQLAKLQEVLTRLAELTAR
ncbi:UPF0182 family protein [Chloroflexota bacterium]